MGGRERCQNYTLREPISIVPGLARKAHYKWIHSKFEVAWESIAVEVNTRNPHGRQDRQA